MTGFSSVFRRATVVDGTGAPRYGADVAVLGDRIAAIGNLAGVAAEREIEASGLILAPGFIDVHSHDDNALLTEPGMPARITQGVTTLITGNCGISLAPLVCDHPPPPLDLLSARGGSPYRFATFASYLAAVRAVKPVVNVASLVGHSTLRLAVMDDVARAATLSEIAAMKVLLEEALSAGAIGMSSGLFYPPARASSEEELVALLETVARFGGVYATHMRDEADNIDVALEESFSTARRAGVPLIISHHKCMGRRNFGRSVETLGLIDAAARRQRVGFDAYPYTAGSSSLLKELVARSERTQLSWSAPHPEAAGRDLAEIAAEWKVSISEAIVRLQPAGAVYHMMDPGDLDRILSHPSCMIGSDGMPHDEVPHPRQWGTFPRVLGHFCRDRGLFSLEQIIHRMTELPARTFRLEARGTVRAGAFADLVVFDPERIRDVATFDDPVREAEGIAMVMVNGALILDH